MKDEAQSGALLAAAELKRLLSSTSEATKARYAAIEADCDEADLPPERDFLREIRIGIHAPSLHEAPACSSDIARHAFRPGEASETL